MGLLIGDQIAYPLGGRGSAYQIRLAGVVVLLFVAGEDSLHIPHLSPHLPMQNQASL